jgi:hypothetical protein
MSTVHAHDSSFVPSLKRNLRRTPRMGINMHLKIFRTIGCEKKLVPGYARNISEGGLAAFIPAQVFMDERLELKFTLPGTDRELTVTAIVRLIEKFQYGLEFARLDEIARNLIAEHCRIAS